MYKFSRRGNIFIFNPNNSLPISTPYGREVLSLISMEAGSNKAAAVVCAAVIGQNVRQSHALLLQNLLLYSYPCPLQLNLDPATHKL